MRMPRIMSSKWVQLCQTASLACYDRIFLSKRLLLAQGAWWGGRSRNQMAGCELA